MSVEHETVLTDGGADSSIVVGTARVYGLPIDAQTRCVHWDGPSDVVAIGFRCCGRLYPCHECHEAVTDHPAEVWPVTEWDQRAVLCGGCATLHPIAVYLGADSCVVCGAAFNPRCRLHHHLYFA
jgi:uncharacterized CHY-type Zn-finger protein